MQKHFEYSIIIAILCASFSYLLSQTGYSQSEQQNFTAPKFGISMQYPTDWTFVPEEEAFTPGIYDYSVFIPPGSATLGAFCPTSGVGSNPEVLGCETSESDIPVFLKIQVLKLKEGTTLKEFYDQNLVSLEQTNDQAGRKIIETNKINVSGLSAIQTIATVGGGTIDKLLESTGQETTEGKQMFVYVVNDSTGYEIYASFDGEKDYDTYLPTIQKMIDSIQVQGAKDAPTNEQLIDTSTSKEKCETLNKIIEDIGGKDMKMECG